MLVLVFDNTATALANFSMQLTEFSACQFVASGNNASCGMRILAEIQARV